jgi:UDP-glucose 4-epimerase
MTAHAIAGRSGDNDPDEGPVLVTGGAGFIGRHVVAALVSRGRRTVVLDDGSSGNPSLLPREAEVVLADVADPAVAPLIARMRPGAIVHAAAQTSVPRSMADPRRDLAVNLAGTAHVIDGARGGANCRVVFLSSGGAVYGDTEEPATEQTLPNPKSFYAVHKYAAETYLELSGLSHAIARLANVYGPGQRTDLEGGVVAIFADRLTTRQPITVYGSGMQRRDLVHVDDVVNALLAMLDTDADGVWNVGTGVATTINELLASMERWIAPAVEICREPARPGDVFSSFLSNHKIAAELGWRPSVSLAEGIRTLARQHETQG